MRLEDRRRDRAIGCMLGLAVGDALGTTVEFKPRGTFPLVTDMVGGGPFDLEPGQWTDDTSMMLCLAESLLHDQHLDAIDLLERFSRWWLKGENSCTGECFDIGNQTREALQHYKRTGIPVLAPTDAAGNGGIMRLAPVAVRWCDDPKLARLIAQKQSCTTHNSRDCDEAADVLTEALVTAINDGKLLDVAYQMFKGLGPEAVLSTGYSKATLHAALWAVATTSSFKEAVLAAVNLGDDTDTVGAVTGQIAGALYGASAISREWLEKLAWRERIQQLAETLYDAGAFSRDATTLLPHGV